MEDSRDENGRADELTEVEGLTEPQPCDYGAEGGFEGNGRGGCLGACSDDPPGEQDERHEGAENANEQDVGQMTSVGKDTRPALRGLDDHPGDCGDGEGSGHRCGGTVGTAGTFAEDGERRDGDGGKQAVGEAGQTDLAGSGCR
ncbi:hypothetical protein FrCorBMG51_06535 [Protofrankia coriariae]|uniref:Uncharacterized protein n=1 Tax=Protofrankia coriariae TaxID=1562887 RepID=A0ABR5F5V7_9ACTN|nr:hypothetical protein FrCorBMG51_06535 [Protofrankia coriariae]